jgi:hypothetical protein
VKGARRGWQAFRRRLLVEWLENRHALAAGFSEFVDPDPTIGDGFGTLVFPLSTGNVVITAPFDDAAGQDAGAVYLFNGRSGNLISTLTGGTANDHAGKGFVRALTNGNFVVISSDWDKDPDDADVGAATWGSGVTGVSGVINSANSLIGSSSDDFQGAAVAALTNGNYVVAIPGWDTNNLQDVGAGTWGDGTIGVHGPISAANSLVGSAANDRVGSRGVFPLGNGNYVVDSPHWSSDTGAATFASGTTGITGPVLQSNSLIGDAAGDQVGSSGIVELSNGNYIVDSPHWTEGGLIDVGAVTWGSGTSGVKGGVDSTNSLVGRRAGDLIGGAEFGDGSVTALHNGSYVVSSPNWDLVRPSDHKVFADVGAVTFASGPMGITGTISSANSLIGSTAGDEVGLGGVTVLTNGNYVVDSTEWSNNGVFQAGAVTWGSGTSGVEGLVSSSNSLVGTHGNDTENQRVAPLTNGNYVVESSSWNAGAGAVTFGDGTMGITGEIDASNSLVGTLNSQSDADLVGYGGVAALTNGNYVVCSPFWNNGTVSDAGAATFGNGVTGIHGAISGNNSLVGTETSDQVGFHCAMSLKNGNYVVLSPNWNNGAAMQVGAVTFGDGNAGSIHGAVTPLNSLVGSTAGDQVGSRFAVPLPDGNYVVISPLWDQPGAGGAVDIGAATFASGTSGLAGPISVSNSLIGSTGGDSIASGNAFFFQGTGNYYLATPAWDSGAIADAGAVTFGSGVSGVEGMISAQNSALGTASNTEVFDIEDQVNDDFYALFPDEGRVLVGSTIDGFSHHWHLAAHPLDVNNDTHVAANDVVAVVNYINAGFPSAVGANAPLGQPFGFLDVTGDDFVAANDALAVINAIDAGQGGEGESQESGVRGQESVDRGRATGDRATDQGLLMWLAMDANQQAARRRVV